MSDTPKAKVETIRVAKTEADMRLDRWFRAQFPDVGHVYLQKLLRSGQVRVNSKRAGASDRLEAGSEALPSRATIRCRPLQSKIREPSTS